MHKVFRIVALLALIFTIAYQVYSFFNVTKDELADGYNVDGIPLMQEISTFVTGYIELSLEEPQPGENIQIHINGDYFSDFYERSMKINVKENDVIELVNISITDNNIKARIISKSDNFDEKYLNQYIISSAGRAMVGRILADSDKGAESTDNINGAGNTSY